MKAYHVYLFTNPFSIQAGGLSDIMARRRTRIKVS